jgi:hypothetical protein
MCPFSKFRQVLRSRDLTRLGLLPSWSVASSRTGAASGVHEYLQAAQQSQGIQTLLEAEKDAAKTVQQARQCTSREELVLAAHPLTCAIADRVEQLKKARSEASKEIEEYKKTKEQEFKSFESSVRYHTLASAS